MALSYRGMTRSADAVEAVKLVYQKLAVAADNNLFAV